MLENIANAIIFILLGIPLLALLGIVAFLGFIAITNGELVPGLAMLIFVVYVVRKVFLK